MPKGAHGEGYRNVPKRMAKRERYARQKAFLDKRILNCTDSKKRVALEMQLTRLIGKPHR